MNVEDKVQGILAGNAALVAQVPVARIKTPGDWQAISSPYIIHQPVAGEVFHNYDGELLQLQMWSFYEVSIYATTHYLARTIGNLVVAALDGFMDADIQRIALGHPPVPGEYDTDRKIARLTLDFEIAGGLT